MTNACIESDLNESDEEERRRRFVELLNENHSRLFGFLYSHVFNIADAEDLFQQVALVLWTKFDRFEIGTDFGAWAMQIADFTIKNFIRGKRRSKVYFSDEVMRRIADKYSSVSTTQVTRRVEALRGCLKKLSKPDLRLLDKCYGADVTIKQVARVEGRSPEAVYTALSRIRKVLLGCIERTLRAEATI